MTFHIKNIHIRLGLNIKIDTVKIDNNYLMKSRKIKYLITGSMIFCALMSINGSLKSNDKDNKSNFIINYDRNSITNEENEVRIGPENKKTGAEILPVPDISKPITLDVL